MRNICHRAVFLILLPVLFLYGCFGVSSRIREHQAEFDSYPKAVQDLIMAKKISTGFTANQVYIALGKPFNENQNRWSYTSCNYKKILVLKSESEYKHDYEDAWHDYEDKRRTDKRAVFVPPYRFKEKDGCRRYISQIVNFSDGIVFGIEKPLEFQWVDPDWN